MDPGLPPVKPKGRLWRKRALQKRELRPLLFDRAAGKIGRERERTLTFILVALFSVVCAGILGFALQWQARRRLQRKLERAVNRHFDRLVGIRAHALCGDDAGPIGPAAWQQEIERFLDGAFSVTLTRQELRGLEERKAQLARLVAARVRLGVTQLAAYQ